MNKNLVFAFILLLILGIIQITIMTFYYIIMILMSIVIYLF